MAELQRVSSLKFADASNTTSVTMETISNGHINMGHINGGFNELPEKTCVSFGEHRDHHRDTAVLVTNAYKSYMHAKKKVPVLQNLNMTVKKGTIYSLLGSSGCGKTTTMQCLVGLTNLESGKILIFGKTPVRSGRVGYMPQETALYKDFSIRETITYFASLAGMKESLIAKRWDVISNLLNLLDDTRRISTLSGGQKRRVSLAVSLIHSPPLLILDEPTVGVDPLLRQNIWKHLMELVSNTNTTIIITTHYLDEAKNTGRVGIMRGGKLLAEASPESLFEKFKVRNLEQILLNLCNVDDGNKTNEEQTYLDFGRSPSNPKIKESIVSEAPKEFNKQISRRLSSIFQSWDDQSYQPPSLLEAMTDSAIRVKSLIMKNCYMSCGEMFCNLVMFMILLPALQTMVMGMSMGNDPRPIKVGVVNYDYNYTGGCNLDVIHPPGECDVANLSCQYLSYLPRDTIQLSYYNNEQDARNDIVSGEVIAFMTFSEGYSNAMYERSGSNIALDNDTVQDSMIFFEMDASNAVVTKSLQKVVYETFQTFVQRMLSDCGLNPELGGLPIKFQNPIYGRYDLELREYVAAGVLVGVALFFPLLSSSITYIWDKKQGTMERARVVGTQTWEIMAAYFATEGLVLCLQTILSLLILIFVFKISIVGSTFLAILLLLLNGLAGISLGLLIASICSEEIQAVLLGLAIIFPNFFLAGSIWPIQGMPIVFQYVSYFLPGTLANESFRSIVVRGWGFTHFHVWIGFAATFAWLCLYFALVILVHNLKLRKN